MLAAASLAAVALFLCRARHEAMRMKTISAGAAALGALMCAACSKNNLTVDVQGAMPTNGTFTLVEFDGEPAGQLVADLSRYLREEGLEQAEGADYLVELGAAERTAGTGSLVPVSSGTQSWLRAPDPSRRRSRLRTLTLVVTDRQGRDVYRALATSKGGRNDADWAPLLDQLVRASGPNRREAGER